MSINDNGARAEDPLLAVPGLAGILAAVLIVVATGVGVALQQDANHVSFTLSELYEVGAPNAWWPMPAAIPVVLERPPSAAGSTVFSSWLPYL